MDKVIIKLTPEQTKQLQPLADKLCQDWLETGERKMFVGQVITDDGPYFDRVVFGLIPPGQSLEIERIRGFGDT